MSRAWSSVKPPKDFKAGDDDWSDDDDSNANFVNDVSEKEQRWGSKTVQGSGRQEAFDVSKVRQEGVKAHEEKVKEDYLAKPTFAHGYGGKFGVQTDRMDKSAVGHEYTEKPSVAAKPSAAAATTSKADIRSRFESMGSNKEEEDRKRIEAERKARAEADAKRREEERIAREKQQKEDAERRAREEEKRAQEKKEREEAERKRKEQEEKRRLEQEEANRKGRGAKVGPG
eukprot:Colp12_sorted_trinity150504_noHs@7803